MKNKIENKSQLLRAYRSLWSMMNKKEKFNFCLLTFLVVFRCFAAIAITQVLTCLINEISGLSGSIFGIKIPQSWDIFQVIIFTHILMIIIWCITAIIGHITRIFSIVVSCRIHKEILNILNSPRKNLDFGMTNGEALFIANMSGGSVTFLIQDLLLRIFLPIGACIIALIYIIQINVVSFFMFLLCFVFILVSSFIRLRFESKYHNKIEKSRSKINNIYLNNIENLSLITLANSQKIEENKLSVHNDEYRDNQIKNSGMRMKYWFFAYFFQYMLIGLGIIACVIDKGSNISSIASIVALVSYSQQLCSPLESVGIELGLLQSKAIQINSLSLLKVNQEREMILEEINRIPKNDTIKKIVMKNIELEIGTFNKKYNKVEFLRNNVIVINGDSGKGKTVFMGALYGLKQYKNGEIIINDKYKVKSLLKSKDKISYVSQNSMIFDRSIIENIAYPGNKLTKKMKEYVKIFKLQHLIDRETENVNVIKTLSGGEQRRISLVRGMSKDADVYFFDEPTNDLDNENVSLVITELLKLKKNAIVIVISHDKRILSIADNIIKIK